MQMSLILIGLGLVAFLIIAFQRSKVRTPQESMGTFMLTYSAAAEHLRFERISEGIFSQADLQFILKDAPELRGEFVRERRALALQWIAQTRNSLRAIMWVHRISARENSDVSPELELKLALNYGSFLAIAALAETYIWLRGPFASRKLVAGLVGAGNRIRSCSETLLGSIDPLILERMGAGQPGGTRLN